MLRSRNGSSVRQLLVSPCDLGPRVQDGDAETRTYISHGQHTLMVLDYRPLARI